MKWERVYLKGRGAEINDADRKPRGRKGGTAGPGKKWGHTCNAVKNGRQVYVFGGYGRDERQTNDTHIYDLTKEAWSKPNVKGVPPSPRDSHTCTTIGSRLFVFGGTDGSRPLQDLYVLDTTTNTWTREDVVGALPEPREGHCAAGIGPRIYVFGGCGKTPTGDDIYFNDVHVFNTETMTWSRPAVRGTPPAGRDSHSCSAWGGHLVVFGGEDCNNCYLDDVFLLDASSMEWKEMAVTGDKPAARAGHVAVAASRHLVIFGGFTDERQLFNDLHTLDLATGRWDEHRGLEGVPSPRFSLSADIVEGDTCRIFFFGGCNNNLEALDDMFFLHTGLRADDTHRSGGPWSIKRELKRKAQETATLYPLALAHINNKKFNSGTGDAARFHFDAAFGGAIGAAGIGGFAGGFGGGVSSAPGDGGRGAGLRAAGSSGAGGGSMEVQPVAECAFEARISDVFHFGYCIKAQVDGRQVDGLLFSYRPGFVPAAAARNFQKRMQQAMEDRRLGKRARMAARNKRILLAARVAQENAAANASAASAGAAGGGAAAVASVAGSAAAPGGGDAGDSADPSQSVSQHAYDAQAVGGAPGGSVAGEPAAGADGAGGSGGGESEEGRQGGGDAGGHSHGDAQAQEQGQGQQHMHEASLSAHAPQPTGGDGEAGAAGQLATDDAGAGDSGGQMAAEAAALSRQLELQGAEFQAGPGVEPESVAAGEPEMKEQEERDDTPFSIVANSEPAAPQGLGVSEGVQMTETTFQGDQAPFDDMPPAPEGGGPRDGEGNEGSGDLARETDEFVDAEAQFADDEDLEAQYSHAAAGVAGDPSKPDVGDEHLDHAAFGGMEMAGDGTYGSFVPDSADL